MELTKVAKLLIAKDNKNSYKKKILQVHVFDVFAYSFNLINSTFLSLNLRFYYSLLLFMLIDHGLH